MSTLTLDRSDTAVDDLVSTWVNGGKYRVLVDVEQIGSDPKMATFHVARVENQTPGEGETNAEGAVEAEEPEAPAPKAKPAVKVQY